MIRLSFFSALKISSRLGEIVILSRNKNASSANEAAYILLSTLLNALSSQLHITLPLIPCPLFSATRFYILVRPLSPLLSTADFYNNSRSIFFSAARLTHLPAPLSTSTRTVHTLYALTPLPPANTLSSPSAFRQHTFQSLSLQSPTLTHAVHHVVRPSQTSLTVTPVPFNSMYSSYNNSVLASLLALKTGSCSHLGTIV